MLGDITQAKNVYIYIVCGRTDMRKGIRGLRLLCCRTIRWIPQTAACSCFAVKAGAN